MVIEYNNCAIENDNLYRWREVEGPSGSQDTKEHEQELSEKKRDRGGGKEEKNTRAKELIYRSRCLDQN